MISRVAMKEDFKPLRKIFKTIKYNFNFRKNNPGYFYPDGLFVFCGPQGSGKTLSAVNYVYNLLKYYPQALLVTNIDLTDYPIDNKRVFRFKDASDLKRYNNDKKGVIFLIDEIHLYFNSLQSKNINPDVMTQIAQQRKQRKHIICTSQVFGRMAKPLREQFSHVMLCKGFLGFFQKLMLLDRDSIDGEESTGTNLKGKVVRNFWYVRSPEMFKRYDTYSVIDSNNVEVSSIEPIDIYNERSK